MDAGSAWRALSGTAAEFYQQHLVPGMFAPWAPLLADLVEVLPGEVRFDVACRTSVVARTGRVRGGRAPHLRR